MSRSLKKGPYINVKLENKVLAMNESGKKSVVNRNRSSLSKTAFIPMLAWETSFSIQRELMLWSDSYIVLPYDVLFLREVVHKAVYGKREAKQIYLEDLGEWANQFVCVNEEQVAFLRHQTGIHYRKQRCREPGAHLIYYKKENREACKS